MVHYTKGTYILFPDFSNLAEMMIGLGNPDQYEQELEFPEDDIQVLVGRPGVKEKVEETIKVILN